eukprot:jgi/Chlat1/1155/Chrsp112S01631
MALGQLLCFMAATVWPALASIRALDTGDKDDDRQWLTYWVVYGVAQFIEWGLWPVLSYVPLYFYIKLVLVLWLSLPQTYGAAYLYNNYIGPTYKKHAPPSIR